MNKSVLVSTMALRQLSNPYNSYQQGRIQILFRARLCCASLLISLQTTCSVTLESYETPDIEGSSEKPAIHGIKSFRAPVAEHEKVSGPFRSEGITVDGSIKKSKTLGSERFQISQSFLFRLEVTSVSVVRKLRSMYSA